MKIIISYITLLLIFCFCLTGCDKPAVTELVQDENEYTVEVMTDNPSDELQSIDSIGVTDKLLRYASVVTLAGISVSYYNVQLSEASAAQALLFDRNKPIYSPSGDLISYHTITPGIIRFADKTARILPYKIKFRKGGLIADTTAGNQYILFSRQRLGDPFEFPYDSFISLSYTPLIGQNGGSIDISTPKKINANIRINGRLQDNTLNVVLDWDKDLENKIDIIICGRIKSKEIDIPLLRFRTEDDGEFIIPSEFLNTIRFNLYDKIILLLERKSEKRYSFERGDLYTFSKSIHIIVIDIP